MRPNALVYSWKSIKLNSPRGIGPNWRKHRLYWSRQNGRWSRLSRTLKLINSYSKRSWSTLKFLWLRRRLRSLNSSLMKRTISQTHLLPLEKLSRNLTWLGSRSRESRSEGFNSISSRDSSILKRLRLMARMRFTRTGLTNTLSGTVSSFGLSFHLFGLLPDSLK